MSRLLRTGDFRDYGCDGQLGLEPTPEAYVANLVAVFREVRRVMRPDATLWLNLGDCFFASGQGYGDTKTTNKNHNGSRERQKPIWADCGLKPKDLVGIPWRVAFALQADGWYLRQDIIWSKPNPMPESVTDRCTKAHEYIFLLSKSAKYYYDAEAIKEPAVRGWAGSDFDGPRDLEVRPTTGRKPRQFGASKPEGTLRHDVGNMFLDNGTRNKRSVWTVTTQPFKDAHFATFPPALITPCILAGCPQGGTVLDPFGGSGTVGEVAETAGRNSILIELNPRYCEMIKRRTAQQGLFTAPTPACRRDKT